MGGASGSIEYIDPVAGGKGIRKRRDKRRSGIRGQGPEGWAWAYLSNIRVQNVNNIELFVIFVCLRSVLIYVRYSANGRVLG